MPEWKCKESMNLTLVLSIAKGEVAVGDGGRGWLFGGGLPGFLQRARGKRESGLGGKL